MIQNISTADEAAITIKSCEAGTARGPVFFLDDAEEKFTKCRPCDVGTYQNLPGKEGCVDVPPGKKAINERKCKLFD